MAQPRKNSVPENEFAADRHGKHRLDRMQPRLAKHLVMFHPSDSVIADLMAEARREIPGMAETVEVQKVLRRNPEYMFALTRKSRFNPDAPHGEGFVAMLPLNWLGLQHLALGTFNAASPDPRLLAGPQERPAGVYLWAVHAVGSLVAGMALFMEKMATEQYAGVDIYSRPNTDVGRRFNFGMGFVEGTVIGGIDAPNVWVFRRQPELPLYDSYVPNAGAREIGVTIARTMEDISRVIALRSAVYIGEQECPYEEEFDGNDFAAATHLLAYVGDEPAGCLRVRFFADFAKLERLAIRKEFRKSRAAFQLVRAALKLCQKKGYRRAYGHSQARLVSFWGRFGFKTFEGGKSLVFSDFDYIELAADLERDPEAVAIGGDPYVIIRPEGRWHVTGVLEKSANRAVTRPSVG